MGTQRRIALVMACRDFRDPFRSEPLFILEDAGAPKRFDELGLLASCVRDVGKVIFSPQVYPIEIHDFLNEILVLRRCAQPQLTNGIIFNQRQHAST